MKKLLLALAVLSATSAFAAGPKVPYTHEGFYSTDKVQKAVHFVSVEDIKKSLEGKGPINVLMTHYFIQVDISSMDSTTTKFLEIKEDQ